MNVWIILETRKGETSIESVWPTYESANEYVRIIIKTKPRPELWGMFTVDLCWTDGIDSIRIDKREVRTPGPLTLPEGWTENKCIKCESHIGYGKPEAHIELCDDCAEVGDEDLGTGKTNR